MSPLQAPLIIAALAELQVPREGLSQYERGKQAKAAREALQFEKAVTLLNAALDGAPLYKVAFQDAKSTINDVMDLVLEPKAAAIRQGTSINTDDIPPYYVGMQSVRSTLRRLTKRFGDSGKVPGILAYMTLLQEFLPFVEAVDKLKTNIVKGRRPSLQPPKPVDLTNTGTCAICMNRQKLMPGNQAMVHHGFKISEGMGHYLGYRAGRCFGTAYRPFEKSCTANVDYRKLLISTRDSKLECLANLRGGKVLEITRLEMKRGEDGRMRDTLVRYTPEDKRWSGMLSFEIAQVSLRIDSLQWEIERQAFLIDNWKEQPLP